MRRPLNQTPLASRRRHNRTNGPELFATAIGMMTQMMQQSQMSAMEAQKQSNLLMMKFFEQKSEPRGLSDLEGLLKIADRLADRGGGGDEGGMGAIIGQALAAILSSPARPAIAPPAQQRPAAPALPAANEPHALEASRPSTPEQPRRPELSNAQPAATPSSDSPSLPADLDQAFAHVGQYLVIAVRREESRRRPDR